MQSQVWETEPGRGKPGVVGLRTAEDKLASPGEMGFELTAKARWVWLVGRSARQVGGVCVSPRGTKRLKYGETSHADRGGGGPVLSHPHSPACSKRTLTTSGVHVCEGDTVQALNQPTPHCSGRKEVGTETKYLRGDLQGLVQKCLGRVVRKRTKNDSHVGKTWCEVQEVVKMVTTVEPG